MSSGAYHRRPAACAWRHRCRLWGLVDTRESPAVTLWLRFDDGRWTSRAHQRQMNPASDRVCGSSRAVAPRGKFAMVLLQMAPTPAWGPKGSSEIYCATRVYVIELT